MPRITITSDTYTQINTDDTSYIVQNLTNGQVGAIILTDSSTPSDTDAPVHYFDKKKGCNSTIFHGIVWAKTIEDGTVGIMGLTEG